MSMRIIGGSARGRKLFAPEGMDTRPTTDRVRESLFNMLMVRVEDACVLDLFAGSGALALEALSRGAQCALLNDCARASVKAIARNIALVGVEDKCTLLNGDWTKALEIAKGQGKQFSLVFLDPPYRQTQLYAQVALKLSALGLLCEDALIVMEHLTREPLSLPASFEMTDERHYGEASVAFVRERGARCEGDLSGQL
ncbi:MAG: 16S rRNA (guanine(966)-N(2))-methyltransferase RsmD [Clostridia bacterium]